MQDFSVILYPFKAARWVFIVLILNLKISSYKNTMITRDKFPLAVTVCMFAFGLNV